MSIKWSNKVKITQEHDSNYCGGLGLVENFEKCFKSNLAHFIGHFLDLNNLVFYEPFQTKIIGKSNFFEKNSNFFLKKPFKYVQQMSFL